MTNMGFNQIILESKNGITTITLNRPEVLNALNFRLIDELTEALETTSQDDTIRVIVLKGAGRAFCVGDDLRGMHEPGKSPPSGPKELQEYLWRGYVKVIKVLWNVNKPVIASIKGYALGAGLDIALACDFRIASSDAKFGAPYVLRGLVGGTYLLPKFIGLTKAKELLFTGKMISAEEAKQIGLVNEVVSPVQLDDATQSLASKFANAATAAISFMKVAIHRGLTADLEEGLYHQVYAAHLALRTEDVLEGKKAFIEKREPTFKGK